MKTLKQVEAIDAICESTYKDLVITEAEYQGKKVNLMTLFVVVVRSSMSMLKMQKAILSKYHLVIQQVYQLNVMILQDVNHFVQGIIVILQKTRQLQDIGLVINGVLALK